MTEYFKKIVRSVQVYFPFIQDLRFKIQLGINSILGNPHEEDFTLLKKFPDHGELLFIDIGSNRGEAIQSMLTMKKNCRIIGFEPNQKVHQLSDFPFGGNN